MFILVDFRKNDPCGDILETELFGVLVIVRLLGLSSFITEVGSVRDSSSDSA